MHYKRFFKKAHIVKDISSAIKSYATIVPPPPPDGKYKKDNQLAG